MTGPSEKTWETVRRELRDAMHALNVHLDALDDHINPAKPGTIDDTEHGWLLEGERLAADLSEALTRLRLHDVSDGDALQL